MDPVTQYLKNQNMAIAPAYFGDSQFEIGQRLQHPQWTLVYRVEENDLILCDFASKGQVNGLSSAVSQFVTLLRNIRRNVPQIKRLRGLIIDETGSEEKRKARKALKDILLKQGGKQVIIEDEYWLVA